MLRRSGDEEQSPLISRNGVKKGDPGGDKDKKT
jgi:hypothetical protein